MKTFNEWKDEIFVKLREEGLSAREQFYLVKDKNRLTTRYGGVVTQFAFERGDSPEFAIKRLLNK